MSIITLADRIDELAAKHELDECEMWEFETGIEDLCDTLSDGVLSQSKLQQLLANIPMAARLIFDYLTDAYTDFELWAELDALTIDSVITSVRKQDDAALAHLGMAFQSLSIDNKIYILKTL